MLQAMVLTRKDKMLVTPTGHVYEMYAPHQGGQSVRTLVESVRVTFAGGQLQPVMGSASLKDKTLFLTLTNSHAQDETAVTVSLLGGATTAGGAARVLTGEIHAHNTFEQPESVKPETHKVDASGPAFSVLLPPASVVAVEMALA